MITKDILFDALFVFCPLFFLTDSTRNPYIIQNVVLYMGLAVLAVWHTADALKRKELWLPEQAVSVPFIVFIFWAVLSLLLSMALFPRYRWSIAHFGHQSAVFLILNMAFVSYAAAARVRQKRKSFYGIVRLAVLVGSVASLYAVLQYAGMELFWPESVTPFGSRSVSTFGNPNFLSTYLIMVLIPLTVYFLAEKNLIRKIFIFILWVVNFLGLIITRTRSAWLGLGTGMVILLIYLLRSHRELIRANRKVLIAAAVACVGVLMMPIKTIDIGDGDTVSTGRRPLLAVSAEKVKSITDMTQASYIQRFLIWKSALLMIKDYPVTGVGWGNFEILYPFYQGKFLTDEAVMALRTHANNAHNEFLEIASQTGVVGLGIYIWFFVSFFRYGWNICRRQKDETERLLIAGVLCGIAAVLADNMLNVSIHFPMPALLLWTQIGMVAGMDQTADTTKQLNVTKAGQYALKALVCIAAIAVVVIQYRFFQGHRWYYSAFKSSHTRTPDLEATTQSGERAYQWYPLIVDNNYEIGNAYARMNRHDKAIWAYREAIRANPGYDEIYYNLAVMYLKKEQWDDAVQALLKSLEINPYPLEAWSMLGTVYIEKKQWEKADLALQKVLAKDPDNTDVRQNLNYVWTQMGKDTRQIENLYPPFDIDSTVRELMDKGVMAIQQNRWSEAHDIYRQIVSLDRSNITAAFYLANIYFKMNRFDDAIQWYTAVIGYSPQPDSGVYYNRALAYMMKKEMSLARKDFEKVLTMDPENQSARNYLTQLY